MNTQQNNLKMFESNKLMLSKFELNIQTFQPNEKRNLMKFI